MAGAKRRKSLSRISSVAESTGADRADGEHGPQSERGRAWTSVLFHSFIIVCAILAGASLLWIFSARPSAPQQQQPASATSKASVYQRRLVTTDVSARALLRIISRNYDRSPYGRSENFRYWNNVSHRHFRSSVLAYVTPWNAKGYDMAKRFRAKFTHVSPVWYQLKRTTEGIGLYGRHDVDKQFIEDVRQEGSPLIVPRVVLEGPALDILVKNEEREKAILALKNEIVEMDFDGIVLEAWSLWRAHRVLADPNLRKKGLDFVKLLGSELHTIGDSQRCSSGSRKLIFVIPPPGKEGDPMSFTREDMIYLSDAVDGFSLMTYDYSSPYSPGPNAPLPWIQQCLGFLLGRRSAERQEAKSEHGPETLKNSKTSSGQYDGGKKILMGINFYGNDYIVPQGGSPIVGHEYMSIISDHKPTIIWDTLSKEHFFFYWNGQSRDQKKVVYYPTLKSLSVRLKEAEAWGVGISIWEIGQGLEYFFDVL